MSADEAAPTKKVTVYFTGKIEVDASLLDLEGKERTDGDIVSGVIDGIESAVNDHLMYSDNDRNSTDLVQSIDAVSVWDTTAAVRSVSEAVRRFESETAGWRDADGDVASEHLYAYDSLRASYKEDAWETVPAFADPDFEG